MSDVQKVTDAANEVHDLTMLWLEKSPSIYDLPPEELFDKYMETFQRIKERRTGLRKSRPDWFTES